MIKRAFYSDEKLYVEFSNGDTLVKEYDVILDIYQIWRCKIQV